MTFSKPGGGLVKGIEVTEVYENLWAF